MVTRTACFPPLFKAGLFEATGFMIYFYIFFFSLPFKNGSLILFRTTIDISKSGCMSKGYFRTGKNQPAFPTFIKQFDCVTYNELNE
jgi:hypothetical protein